ncbi:MAG: hypothetical protein ACM3VS_02430 [Candidatus Dadabacteria bacterium]
MARIFNIYFTFEEVTHTAVVSVRKTAFLTEYTLVNFDESLLQLLPGTKIIKRSHENFIFLDANPSHSSALMDTILRAVAEHLEVVGS